MKNTQFKVEDNFADIINEDNISQDQLLKLNNFQPKRCDYKHKHQI